MSARDRAAIRRRDDRLLLIRRLTVGVTGAASAAVLTLGAAFAQAIPGHSPPVHSSVPAPAPDSSPAGGAEHSDRLAPPRHNPRPTSAPHAVTSGGT